MAITYTYIVTALGSGQKYGSGVVRYEGDDVTTAVTAQPSSIAALLGMGYIVKVPVAS